MNDQGAAAKPVTNLYHPHLVEGRAALAIVGVFWSSLQTLIPTISAAAVFFISAWFLSPDDFGLVGLASGIVVSIIAFSPIAFGEALVQRKNLSQSHADSVFWLTLCFGLLCFLPLALGATMIADLLGYSEIATILPVLALKIPLELAAAVPNAIIIRSMKLRLIALRTAVATMISVTICLAMLFSGYGLWALVISQVSASLVACAMAFWVSGWRPGLSIRRAAIREVASYGLYASGNRMLATIKLDHLVMGILGGTAMLGLFLFAQRFYAMLTQLVGGALSSVTLALLSTMQDEPKKAAYAFDAASFLSAAVTMPMFCILAITAPDLLALLLDDKWSGAVLPVQMFCVVGVFAGIGVVQASLIKSQGKPEWWFYYQLLQQGTSVLVIALTYGFGLPVLMIILVGKSVLLWPISVLMTSRLLKQSPWTYLYGFRHPLIATLLMAAAMIAVSDFQPDLTQLARFSLQLLVAGTVYVAVILTLSRERISQFRQYLPVKKRASA